MGPLSFLVAESSHSYYTEGNMYFELSHFTVKIKLDELPILDDVSFHEIDESFINIIETNNINKISIELIDYQNIDDREFSHDYSSLSKDMYFIIKKVNKSF